MRQRLIANKVKGASRLAAEQERMRRRHGAAIAKVPAPVYGPGEHAAEERHFTPAQIAKLWGVSTDTVRRIFSGVPGVLKIGTKGKYVSLRIPGRILRSYHASLAQKSSRQILQRLKPERFRLRFRR